MFCILHSFVDRILWDRNLRLNRRYSLAIDHRQRRFLIATFSGEFLFSWDFSNVWFLRVFVYVRVLYVFFVLHVFVFDDRPFDEHYLRSFEDNVWAKQRFTNWNQFLIRFLTNSASGSWYRKLNFRSNSSAFSNSFSSSSSSSWLPLIISSYDGILNSIWISDASLLTKIYLVSSSSSSSSSVLRKCILFKIKSRKNRSRSDNDGSFQ